MSRFASCYFCGTALDGSVSEQPVVPEDLAPSGGASRSVTLCPDCSRKLAAVLDEVRGAVQAGTVPDAGGGGGGTEHDGDPAASADGDIAADVDIDAEAEEFFEEASQPGAADSASEQGADGAADPEDAGGADRREQADEGATSGGSGRGEEAATTGAGEEAPEAGSAEEEPARQTISALENSKVMRMLENREFPVERQSFQVVAANAYGVSPSDVGKVIDMAIDRGLLAERNGDLVRPN